MSNDFTCLIKKRKKGRKEVKKEERKKEKRELSVVNVESNVEQSHFTKKQT